MNGWLGPLFLVCLVAGLICAVAWRCIPAGRLRTTLQTLGACLVFLPQVPILFMIHRSMELVTYQEALFAAWMTLVGVLLVLRAWRGLAVSGQIKSVFLGALGVGLAGWGLESGREFLWDVFLPREPVHGFVDAVQIPYGTRLPPLADVLVDGHWHQATLDILPQLTRGSRIDAEAGAGSNVLLAIVKR